jgi:hypothetical protein
MTLEQTLSRAIVARLSTLPRLAGVQVSNANDDSAVTVPRVTVAVTRGAVSIPGYAVYRMNVEIVIHANAWSAASPDKSTSGNQTVELMFDQIEALMTGDVTQLSNGGVIVYGAEYDGGVSDTRDDRLISRAYTFTLQASPRS